MTFLERMPAVAFPAFVDAAVAAYAVDNMASGRWLAHEAEQLARSELERLLPGGVATPDNHFYEIKGQPAGAPVGFVWFAAMPRGERRLAYVFQLLVYSQFRRRGHARAALVAVESLASGLGLSSIELNVFASNSAAQSLYESIGYNVASTSMRKELPPDVA